MTSEFYDAIHQKAIVHRGRRFEKIQETWEEGNNKDQKYHATFQDTKDPEVTLSIHATKQTGKGLGNAGTKWNVQGKLVRTMR